MPGMPVMPVMSHEARAGSWVRPLAWTAVLLDGFDLVVLGTALPVLLRDRVWGLTPGTASAVSTVGLVGMMLDGLAIGTFTDRIGRRKALTLVTEHARAGKGGSATTTVMTGYHVGAVLTALLGIGLVPALGWRAMFAAGALPAVVRGLFSGGFLRATIAFWVTSFLGLVLVYGLNTWLPEIMRQAGYQLGAALSLLLALNLGGIVGLLVAGFAADRAGARRSTIAWFTAAAVFLALLSVRLPGFGLYVAVFLAGCFVFSAQVLVYAYVGRYRLPVGLLRVRADRAARRGGRAGRQGRPGKSTKDFRGQAGMRPTGTIRLPSGLSVLASSSAVPCERTSVLDSAISSASISGSAANSIVYRSSSVYRCST
ncbi:hypothetical protein GCM10009754_66030 [Amycolatopsis minnesotensis]|uniref:MFS transporter n=1 Tax=Amycolatopsis minnesotensis TaxID=337894 RepID=A0ABN2S4E5_9PSEU